MLSSQMKNKIVFVVAIGFLLGLAQCRPLEDSSLVAIAAVEDKVLLPAVASDAKPLVAVKDEVVAEASKDPESTILAVVPVVVVTKADSSEENKSKVDSSSEESKESKESSEEIKASPAAAAATSATAESTNVADVIVPAPVVEVMAAIEPAVAVVENTVEPLVAAVEAAMEQAVEAESSPVVKPLKAEPIVATVDVVIEPAATEQEAKTQVKPDAAQVVEDSVAAPSSPVADAINTKAIDAEELVKPEATPAAAETTPKIIIVTPSSDDIATPSDASVDSKIDALKEIPVAPVEEITKPIESDAPTTEAKVEEAIKATEKSSEALKSKN